jgi:hypothetical protein
MIYAIIVIALFLFVLLVVPRLAHANPSRIAGALKRSAGAAMLGLAALLALRGAVSMAVGAFLFGLALLRGQGGFGSASKSSGQSSGVKTSMLSMELDHDTGAMDGEVLSGAFQGQRLSDLSLEQLLALLGECASANDRSDALLIAYLDRAHPDWRNASGAGGGAAAGQSMSRAEALDLLGLKEGASEKEIQAAYRRMMKKHHPDSGGSQYLAARINEAKNILLRKA